MSGTNNLEDRMGDIRSVQNHLRTKAQRALDGAGKSATNSAVGEALAVCGRTLSLIEADRKARIDLENRLRRAMDSLGVPWDDPAQPKLDLEAGSSSEAPDGE